MIESSLAIGTIWFWLIVVLASIIIIACVENEHYPTPSVVAIILGAIYWKSIVALPRSVIAIAINERQQNNFVIGNTSKALKNALVA